MERDRRMPGCCEMCVRRISYCGGCCLLAYVDDNSELLPEEDINNYAIFMAVRGLGFLVVTWTTVVLLGGFVSVIGKKDFWCLTLVTLSQTAGVFDVFLNEKLGSIMSACQGLLIVRSRSTAHYKARIDTDSGAGSKPKISARVATYLERKIDEGGNCGRVIRYMWLVVLLCLCIVRVAKGSVQILVFAGIILPLAALYMFGLYISTSISLWRLIQHDYSEDGGTNMKPALNVLYSLAVVQGLVFCYKISFTLREKKMVLRLVSRTQNAHINNAALIAVTWEYLRGTKTGCEKDPSFATGRNLITYAVDLMESRSPDSYLSGTEVLNTLLDSKQHNLLIKQLVARGGSSHLLQKLLGTLDQGSPYCGETRKQAVNIVARLASWKQIRLAQFPGGIQLVSSMLENTSQIDDGLRILEHLAGDEGNRIVMRNTPDLLPSIIAPRGGMHSVHSPAWSIIAGLIGQLATDARGETGLRLRREISYDDRAVGALENILKCGGCDPQDRIKANDILADLSSEMASRSEDNSPVSSFRARHEENLVRILVHNFLDVDRREEEQTHSRVDFAGSKLAEVSRQSKSSAKLILRANDVVAARLIAVIEKEAYGSASAAEILTNLCSHYSKDDESFDRLKKALTDAMRKVLTEMLPRLRGQEIRAVTEEHNSLATGGESEIVSASQEDARNQEKGEGVNKLKETLKSFCSLGRICDKLISTDHQDLSHQFDEVIAAVCLDSAKPARTLASLVQEAHEALEAMEAQEALDEKMRAEDAGRGMATAGRTEEEAPFSGFSTAPLPEV